MNTWIGRPVEEKNLFYSEIDTNIIPTFRREPFEVNGVENPHLDTIVHTQKWHAGCHCVKVLFADSASHRA